MKRVKSGDRVKFWTPRTGVKPLFGTVVKADDQSLPAFNPNPVWKIVSFGEVEQNMADNNWFKTVEKEVKK